MNRQVSRELRGWWSRSTNCSNQRNGVIRDHTNQPDGEHRLDAGEILELTNRTARVFNPPRIA